MLRIIHGMMHGSKQVITSHRVDDDGMVAVDAWGQDEA